MPYKEKENKAICQRQYYSRNKEYYKEKRKSKRKEIDSYILDFKLKASCKFCFENDPVCLQFHHLVPEEKDIEIANARRQGWSIERLQTEINKCIIVCSNCHFKIHAGKILAG